MARIVISYRREDKALARYLRDRLQVHFGHDNVFMDPDNLEPGFNLIEVIAHTLALCDVLIAVIGPRWLTSTDAPGQRRLDDPYDFGRLEIATAFRRNIRVLPVLVRGSSMPDIDDLPDDLQPLFHLTWVNLELHTSYRFDWDVDQLVTILHRMFTEGTAVETEPASVRDLGSWWDYLIMMIRRRLDSVQAWPPEVVYRSSGSWWDYLIMMIRRRLDSVQTWPPEPSALFETSRGNFSADLPMARDPVDCTVFAPQKIALGEKALIQVFIHLPEEAEELGTVAEAADPRVVRRGATTLSTEIARGSRLMFALNIPRVIIDEPVQEIVWSGTKTSVQFSVTAPKKLFTTLAPARLLSLVAAISVSQDGVVIGQIKFVLQIERTGGTPNDPQIIGEAQRYETAFISYASENRPEVLRCVQMLRLVGISRH